MQYNLKLILKFLPLIQLKKYSPRRQISVFSTSRPTAKNAKKLYMEVFTTT